MLPALKFCPKLLCNFEYKYSDIKGQRVIFNDFYPVRLSILPTIVL